MSRILVIDDEENVREMIELALTSKDHEVTTTSDAEQGLGEFGDGKNWDLVILDQRLPDDEEGTEVLAKMQEKNPYTRALVITAYNSVNVAIESLKAGVVAILKKPFSTDQLRASVANALVSDPKPSSAVSTEEIMEVISRKTPCGITFNVSESHFDDKLKRWEIKIEAQSPEADNLTEVHVYVPQYTMELAKAFADSEDMPGQEQFWTALAEEALAHYCQMEGALPPDGVLNVGDIDPHLNRWIESVISVN